MTTSPSDVRHRCLHCNEPCRPRERFCDDQCYDAWFYGAGEGLVVNPGYSTLPLRATESYMLEVTEKTLRHGRRTA